MKRNIVKLLFFIPLIFLFASCNKSSESSDSSNEDSYSQIKKNGELKIGTEGTYAPFSYHDENDKLVGFDVEIAEAVADKLGLKATFVESPWDSLLAAFDANKCDTVFNQVGITKERKEKYNFSTPYTYSKTALITNSDNTDINSFSDLDGKSSAQTITSNYAKVAESYGATIESTDGFSKSIELVISGRADATLNDDVAFYDYLKQKPDSPIKIAAMGEETITIGALIKKDNNELLTEIDKALKELRDDGTLTSISEKYFDKDITKE